MFFKFMGSGIIFDKFKFKVVGLITLTMSLELSTLNVKLLFYQGLLKVNKLMLFLLQFISNDDLKWVKIMVDFVCLGQYSWVIVKSKYFE